MFQSVDSGTLAFADALAAAARESRPIGVEILSLLPGIAGKVLISAGPA